MFKRCAWCRKFTGIKRPLLDFGVTHGMCKKCYEREKQKGKPVRVRIECVDCGVIEELEGKGCFVAIFNDGREAERHLHHANSQEAIRAASLGLIEEIARTEIEFNQYIKGEG